MHARHGTAHIEVDSGEPIDPHQLQREVNTTPDLLEFEGPTLHAKRVRRWLWERRKERQVTRRTATLWSIGKDGMSYVGIGALTRVREVEHAEA